MGTKWRITNERLDNQFPSGFMEEYVVVVVDSSQTTLKRINKFLTKDKRIPGTIKLRICKMAEKVSSARARVQMTIELDAGSTWGSNCQVQQIYDQAAREAKQHVERIFQEAKENIVIVGTPKVTAVFTKEA